MNKCQICHRLCMNGSIYCQICFVKKENYKNVTRVTDYIYLGSADANMSEFDAVLDVRCRISFEHNDPTKIDAMVEVLSIFSDMKKKIFVYCTAGSERSPLVVACFLVKSGLYPTFTKAYVYLQSIRSVVIDRTSLLPIQYVQTLEDVNDSDDGER